MTAPAPVATAAPRGRSAVWGWCLTATLALLGFFLAFSSAGVAIAEFLLLLLVLARPRVLVRAEVWRDPVMAIGLALLAYIALHTLAASGADRDSVRAINQYQELLLAPVLAALLLRSHDRQVLLGAFAAGCLFLALLYWSVMVEPEMRHVVGERRISAGFALSVAAFLLVLRARGHPHGWWLRGLAAFLTLTVLFALNSRTGYILVLVLAACAAWLHAPRGWRWMAVLAGPLIVLVLALSSESMEDRVSETLAGSQPAGATGEFTSTTIRIELIRISSDLVRRHWLTGAGYANYEAAHERAAGERYPGLTPQETERRALWMRSSNPHNEYVMQLAGGGIVALALFVAWLGAIGWRAASARRPAGAVLAGLTLAFAIGCLFNSLLLDFIEGHVFVALLALLVAECRDAAGREQDFRRIVIVVTRQIGDVLLTTPLLQAARERWPQARIDVLAFAGTAGMLHGNPDLDRLLEYPARLGWTGFRSLVRRLWRQYDLALVADPGEHAPLLAWLAAPRGRGGVAARGARHGVKRRARGGGALPRGGGRLPGPPRPPPRLDRGAAAQRRDSGARRQQLAQAACAGPCSGVGRRPGQRARHGRTAVAARAVGGRHAAGTGDAAPGQGPAGAAARRGPAGRRGRPRALHVAVQAMAGRAFRAARRGAAGPGPAGGADRQRRRPRPGMHRAAATSGPAAAAGGRVGTARLQPARGAAG